MFGITPPPATSLFACAGHETVDNVGTYGTLGTPNADNRPGGREDCAVWVDGYGDWK